MIGKYRINCNGRIRIGLTVFGYNAGRTVTVRQHDTERKKSLVDFGDGYIDWLSDRWLSDNCTFIRCS